jgi:hypothetical protein
MNGEALIELWETMVEFIQVADQQDAADKFVSYCDEQGLGDDLLMVKHLLPGKLKIAVYTHFELDDEEEVEDY